MKRILHLNSYFFSNKLHYQLVNKLAEANFEQTVFIPLKKGEERAAIHSTDNVHYRIVDSFNNIDRYIWPIKILKIWFKLKPLLKHNNFILIHAHSLIVNGSLAYLAKKLFKIPYIVTIRNSDVNTFIARSRIFRMLGRLILDNAVKTTTLSHSYFDYQLQKYYPKHYFESLKKKHLVIPNGGDNFWFENKYKNDGLTEPIKILFVGLIARNKNLDAVITVCNSLVKNGFNIELHIAGSGRRLEEFKSQKKSFPITFYGHLQEKELLQLYRKCHILFVPSFTESFGIVYIEAMTQSLPVIYTKNQGFDGFFANGTFGFAVNPNDIEEMQNCILKIIKNYDTFSKNAFEMVDFFRWDNPIKMLVDLYKPYII